MACPSPPLTKTVPGSAFLAGLLATWALGAAPARAQALVSLLPFDHEGDVYVTDSSLDKVFHLADLNMDGDYLDAGEVVIFYDDTVGPLPLSNNSSLALGPYGRLYVADRGEGRVYVMLDSDGSGTAEAGGETSVFFDGDPLVNAGGLDVVAPTSVTVDAQNVLWLGEADQGGAGTDSVLRLQDLNLDGDANDAGEALRYYLPPMGSTDGDTIVADVFVGADAFLYYVEGSTTGFTPPGLYRLNDVDGNGVIDPVTEVTPFFIVPTSPFPVFLQAGALDGSGYMYLTDTGNDVIWRVRDENGDGTVDPVTEAKVFLVATSPEVIWDLAPTSSGEVLLSELASAGRMLRLDDLDGNGSIDIFTELAIPYLSSVAPVAITNPRGLAWERRPTLAAPTSISIGTTGTGTLEATVGDLGLVYFSTASIPPLALPSLGYLELDANLPAIFGVLTSGIAPDLVPLGFPIAVPSDPALVGLSIFLQAAAGKSDRFMLSNLVSFGIL